jgi:hypothetical protein
VLLTGRDQGWRPTREQELLLRAAVLEGVPALEAWREWRARIDFDSLDRASARVVPQLYRNLVQHEVEDPLLGKLRGIYRHTWLRSQLGLRAVAGVLVAFREAGVDTLVVKGAALAALHYRDPGARPMSDIDVLVPWREATAAMRVLERCGWAPAIDGPPTRHIPYRHAIGFREPRGGELDLHWNALIECCGPGVDDAFWEAAVPLELAGVSTKALCPADQLLQVCVHGARWSRVPLIRWVADAVILLRSAGDTMDWNRLVEEAARRQLVVMTERALTYLAARFQVAVPVTVLTRLRALPRRRFERAECRIKSRARPFRLLGDLPVALFQFLRLADGTLAGRRGVALGDYLAYRWRIEDRSRLPVRVLGKVARRLVRVPLEHFAATARASRGQLVRRLR